METPPIQARAIIQIAGAPKDFVEETMRLLLERLSQDERYKVLSKQSFEAKPEDKLFSTFSEVELELKDIYALMGFCFEYMPSSVEIIEPDSLEFKREELAEFVNDLLQRLHQSDMALKEANAEKKLVEGANRVLVRNTLSLVLAGGPLTMEEIGKKSGITQPHLQRILEFHESQGLLKKEGDKYRLLTKKK